MPFARDLLKTFLMEWKSVTFIVYRGTEKGSVVPIKKIQRGSRVQIPSFVHICPNVPILTLRVLLLPSSTLILA